MIADAATLIAFLPPTPDQFDAGAGKIYDLFASEIDPCWLHSGVEKGSYRVKTVCVDGVPVFLLWFHVDNQAMLVINAATSIRPGKFMDYLADAVEMLARELCCRGFSFQTRRPGLIRESVSRGFIATGIVMQKTF